MNHGRDYAHLYRENGTLRDCMKPCIPEPSEAGDVEGCQDCETSDCKKCGRTIRRCGTVADGCEFCTPFEDVEKDCKHEREDIEWDDKPDMENGDGLGWFGSCACGLRVCEEYTSAGIYSVPDAGDRSFIRE